MTKTLMKTNVKNAKKSLYQLRQDDEARLKETLELRKKGALKYHSLEESLKMSDERLRSVGEKL